jgi:hypothetical protein
MDKSIKIHFRVTYYYLHLNVFKCNCFILLPTGIHKYTFIAFLSFFDGVNHYKTYYLLKLSIILLFFIVLYSKTLIQY